MKKTGMVQRSGLADVDEPVSDDDCFSVVSTDPASAAIRASPPNSMPSAGKQSSYPCANFNHSALRTSQQTGRETNIKGVAELGTSTVNRNGKRDRTAIAESDEPIRPADSVKPPRKIVHTVPTIHPTIMVEQERPHREANQSPLPTVRLSPPDSPPPFISKKINLRPAASCPPCAPDVAGACNINSSSVCGRTRRNQKLSPPATLRPADNPTVRLHPMYPPTCYPFPDVLRLQSPSP